MLSKTLKSLIAVTFVLSATAVIGFAAEADSTLADRIEAGDRRAALEMIQRNTPVNAPQADGTTPLHWAVYRVDEELVKALLARGAKADVVNAFGSSPLAEAARVAGMAVAGGRVGGGRWWSQMMTSRPRARAREICDQIIDTINEGLRPADEVKS